MGFPDHIKRTVQLAHPPAQVWAALTTAEGLGAWFGDEATIDLRPGGAAQLRWTGRHAVDMRVEQVEEPAVFGFTSATPAISKTIRAAPCDPGTLKLVQYGQAPRAHGDVGTGFAQLPEDTYRKEFDSHTKGWRKELGEMAAYLNAA